VPPRLIKPPTPMIGWPHLPAAPYNKSHAAPQKTEGNGIHHRPTNKLAKNLFSIKPPPRYFKPSGLKFFFGALSPMNNESLILKCGTPSSRKCPCVHFPSPLTFGPQVKGVERSPPPPAPLCKVSGLMLVKNLGKKIGNGDKDRGTPGKMGEMVQIEK